MDANVYLHLMSLSIIFYDQISHLYNWENLIEFLIENSMNQTFNLFMSYEIVYTILSW